MQTVLERIRIENAFGVCAVSEDTLLLAQISAQDNPKRGLDLGTGTGYVAIYLALKGCEMDAVDISLRALEVAKRNSKLNQVTINLYKSDLFDSVQNQYDLIACNPPMRGNETELSRMLTATLRRIAPVRNFLMRIMHPFLKSNRLDFLIEIINGAQSKLKENGRLCMALCTSEISHIIHIKPEIICNEIQPVLSIPGLNIVIFTFKK